MNGIVVLTSVFFDVKFMFYGFRGPILLCPKIGVQIL
jgi:hypothetical protein